MGNHKKCFFLLNEKNKAPHTHQDSEYKSEYRSQLKNSQNIQCHKKAGINFG